MQNRAEDNNRPAGWRGTANKVIVRVQGGLGNQLFCYASARRLAIVNDAELVLDDTTGFIRDFRYRRTYQLNHFQIPCRLATSAERLEPMERVRRKLLREASRLLPYDRRPYLAQEAAGFDARLLVRKVYGTVYVDGLWQSEEYFRDISDQIRRDLEFRSVISEENRGVADQIRTVNAVALHLRWFDAPGTKTISNASVGYYERALARVEERIRSPHYFVFSDHPEDACSRLKLGSSRVTLIANNRGDANAWADLWLMSQCQHFVMANSTFSWWAAWLSKHKDKLVICPKDSGVPGSWNFAGQIPPEWMQL